MGGAGDAEEGDEGQDDVAADESPHNRRGAAAAARDRLGKTRVEEVCVCLLEVVSKPLAAACKKFDAASKKEG